MAKNIRLNLKTFVNQKNKQCAVYLPKNKMPKSFKDNLGNVKNVRILLEDWW